MELTLEQVSLVEASLSQLNQAFNILKMEFGIEETPIQEVKAPEELMVKEVPVQPLTQEQINYFDLLPDELLLQYCNNLDNQSLGRFMQTYGRAYQVCMGVLKPKRIEYLYNERIKNIARAIRERGFKYLQFISEARLIGTTYQPRKNEIFISLIGDRTLLYIVQEILNNKLNDWPFPDIPFITIPLYNLPIDVRRVFHIYGTARFAQVDANKLIQIVRTLYDEGFREFNEFRFKDRLIRKSRSFVENKIKESGLEVPPGNPSKEELVELLLNIYQGKQTGY